MLIFLDDDEVSSKPKDKRRKDELLEKDEKDLSIEERAARELILESRKQLQVQTGSREQLQVQGVGAVLRM